MERKIEQADIIFLEGIRADVRIGTTTQERAAPQSVLIHVRIETPLRRAGNSDEIAHTVDYAAVEHKVRQISQSHPFNLVESLAESLAQAILSMGADAVWIRVEKRPFPNVGPVGVEIRRRRP